MAARSRWAIRSEFRERGSCSRCCGRCGAEMCRSDSRCCVSEAAREARWFWSARRESMTALREREREVAPADFGAFRLAWHSSGIVLLWFEDPTRKVNLLDSTNLDALHRSLAALQLRNTPPRALLLVSGKEGQYIAGADVTEFETVSTAADAESKV